MCDLCLNSSGTAPAGAPAEVLPRWDMTLLLALAALVFSLPELCRRYLSGSLPLDACGMSPGMGMALIFMLASYMSGGAEAVPCRCRCSGGLLLASPGADVNLGTIIALSSGTPLPVRGEPPTLNGLAKCMGFETVSMLCCGSVLLAFTSARRRFRRRSHSRRPQAAMLHKRRARPRPSMRPAHQGKLLPDDGALYTVHIAVLLMTVRLKLSEVPEMPHTQPLLSMLVAERAEREKAPRVDRSGVCKLLLGDCLLRQLQMQQCNQSE